MWLPLACPLLGDLAHNPGMYPDWESNKQPFGLQVLAQSSELYQPSQRYFNFICRSPFTFSTLHNLIRRVVFIMFTCADHAQEEEVVMVRASLEF